MAECLFTLSIMYLLLTQYAKTRWMFKYSFITQFFVGWLIIELAWLHGLLSLAFILMAMGDFNGWSFGTLVGVGISLFNAQRFWQLHQQGKDSAAIMENELTHELGEDYRQAITDDRRKTLGLSADNQWLKPFSFKSAQIERIEGLKYGPYPRNTLDIFKPIKDSDKPRPVMLQIHGGGWVLGQGDKQGLPLRNKLVEAGWIFVSINYRLSPKDKFPAHLIDCKQALVWIKEHIAEYGGDANFIMTTGGSAGGHLCSLLALTANREQALLQPGFEDKDTRVQGAIPMYGVYDFVDRQQHRSAFSLEGFLEKTVMPESLSANPALWDLASPVAQVQADRPPFMVFHGELDTLSFVEDARFFVRNLKSSSEQTCVYVELPITQHAFDIFYSPRCVEAVDAMHRFAEHTYSQYLKD